MSPAPERGDRRHRREGWASGSGEADAGKQVHLAKVPWTKAPSSMVKRLQRGKVSSNGRTCDRARPCKMKV